MEGTPFGRYRLVEVLGRGGMGEVWRGFDTVTERTVAVKVLPVHLVDDDGFQKRFLREAKAAASLDEPHVVPIYDFGEVDGRLFVAMRLVDGQDLQTLLTQGPLDPNRAVAIIEQIASALNAAHRIGLIHRDVKPSNILVIEDDFAYLIDFGIARVTGETGLTSTGMTLGTWSYMAPERFRTGTADAGADVYALTCVLHQALTGQQPFPGESLEQIATGHLFDPPPRPSVLRVDVPRAMDAVIATGMAKDPGERYATTRDLARAARAALSAPASPAASVAAGAETLAAPAPALNDAPTQYAPAEAAADPIPTSPEVQLPAGPARRPNTVTAALITTWFAVAITTLVGVSGLSVGASRVTFDTEWRLYTMAIVVGAVCVIVAALAGRGAVTALRGATPKGLLRAPATLTVLWTLAYLVGKAIGGDSWQAAGFLSAPLFLLLPGSLLLTRQSSKDYFRNMAVAPED
ncbi:serine/threonine-protein kinase [Mycobacterium sp. SMC-11]|uniref:serine/threonine-protein kinase n=1 Tax=Mycobacterium sp. SMC-11 TaxID=3385969 RepID=UPI00390C4A70